MTKINTIEENAPTTQSDNIVFPPLGEVFAEARLEKKRSQKDASDFLRYSVAQINALENNQLDVLPQAMITRGFIRNYARYLELDSEPLLASYKLRVPNATPNTVHVGKTDRQIMLTKESQPWLVYILGTIVLLLFLIAWIISVEYLPKDYFQNGKYEKEIVVSPTGLEQSTTQPLPQANVVTPAEEAPLTEVLDNTSENVSSETLPSGEVSVVEAIKQEANTNNPENTLNIATTKSTAATKLADTIKAEAPKAEASVIESAINTTASTVPPVTTSLKSAQVSPNTFSAPKTSVAVNGSPINPIVANNKTTGASIATSANAVKPASIPSNAITKLPIAKTATENTLISPANNLKAVNAVTPVKPLLPASSAYQAPAEKVASEKVTLEKPTADKTQISKPTNQLMNLSFSEQTWVQVTDKTGNIIYERILTAGSQESIGGAKPLNVIIGNAKATKLSFMGKSVDLKPYTTENNVARVRLE